MATMGFAWLARKSPAILSFQRLKKCVHCAGAPGGNGDSTETAQLVYQAANQLLYAIFILYQKCRRKSPVTKLKYGLGIKATLAG